MAIQFAETRPLKSAASTGKQHRGAVRGKQVNVRLQPAQEAAVDRARAGKNRVSRADILRQLVDTYLITKL